jgi:hypothetical protein
VHEMETIRQVVTSKGWPTEHDANKGNTQQRLHMYIFYVRPCGSDTYPHSLLSSDKIQCTDVARR